MIYLAPLFLLTISYLAGALVRKVVRDNDGRVVKTCLVGTFFVLILWSVVLNAFDLMGFSFSTISRIFTIILLIIFFLSLLICRTEIRQQLKMDRGISVVAVLIVSVTYLIMFVCLFLISPDTDYSCTVETVNSLRITNDAFSFNPYTGQPVESVSILERLNSLPYFYGYIAEVFNAKTSSVLYRAIPAWVMALSFMAYSEWAEFFFGKEKKQRFGIAFFICGLGIINLCGTFSANSVYYCQMLKGFTGEALCFGTIIPFCVSECFVHLRNKKHLSGIYILMCIVTASNAGGLEKGFIPVVTTVCICVGIALGYRLRRYLKCKV